MRLMEKLKIRNPKHEIRNITQIEMTKTDRSVYNFF
jgi:hypothetical protein